MTRRLRRCFIRQGMREVRYRISGDRRNPRGPRSLAYCAFLLIAKRCTESRAGFYGVELRLEDVSKSLKCSKRNLTRIINLLDTKHGVLVRIQVLGRPRMHIAEPARNGSL